jgi:5-(carboxyamino)imidazole ribonucleotide synthase
VRIGVIGGGQLGRMLGLAGIPLGCTFTFLDPSPEACARAVGELLVASYDDEESLDRLAGISDVVTYEFENVPAQAVERLTDRLAVYPSSRSLEMSQDRAREKETFEACGIATAPYRSASRRDDLVSALTEIGLPCVVKTRREGYDGKGQIVVRSAGEVEVATETFADLEVIVERFVPFDRELSIIGVRSPDGEVICYPLVENLHYEGILRVSRAPAQNARSLQAKAEAMIRSLLDVLGHVGVLALEMFELDGELVANEMAPRVHNSGHWTIEGAETSQFENHIRAIVGLPLGSTQARGHSVMVNLIGAVPSAATLLDVDGAHVHLYGKEPRPGRKVGHITIRADAPSSVERGLRSLDGLAGVYLGST